MNLTSFSVLDCVPINLGPLRIGPNAQLVRIMQNISFINMEIVEY